MLELLLGRFVRRAIGTEARARCGAAAKDLDADLVGHFRVIAQVLLGVFAALAQADVSIVEPRARLVDQLVDDRQVEQVGLAEMPWVYIMSNSHTRNGGATLFLTTLALMREPTTSSPSLTGPMRRTSIRHEL